MFIWLFSLLFGDRRHDDNIAFETVKKENEENDRHEIIIM